MAIETSGLEPRVIKGEITDADFSAARGLLVTVPDSPARAALDALLPTLRRALAHGLEIDILCRLDDVPLVDRFRRSVPYSGRLRCVVVEQQARVTERLRYFDAGPAWRGDVQPAGEAKLAPEEKLLLRRAFGDCRSVSLVSEPGGRSAKVYCAFARLKDSRAGPVPLPFFVKFDQYLKIKREVENYRDCTWLFIPFNQRPNIDPARCALGADRGVIVGNFIEESETLSSVVEHGTARGPLNSLFGGALRGWRNQAYYDGAKPYVARLSQDLTHCVPGMMDAKRRGILDATYAEAASTFGATASPEDLDALIRGLPERPYRRALMHGDLHGENVRVHRGEAILIDFTSTGHGPLVADPACLDVALVLSSKLLQGAAWRELAQRIYASTAFGAPLPPPDPADPGAVLLQAVRLIRQIAAADQLTQWEYATAAALYLLRRAAFRPLPDEEPSRRAFGYTLAERLLLDISRNPA